MVLARQQKKKKKRLAIMVMKWRHGINNQLAEAAAVKWRIMKMASKMAVIGGEWRK
jgi:6,7-dimethyl-8-ribityllumazine synthase